MIKTPLKQYLENHSQSGLARDIGLTQGAISKMLITGRNIFVVVDKDASVRLVEEKPIAPAA